MGIAVKITLVASVILIGYNLSQMLTSYEGICEKVKKFKALAVETDSRDDELKRSNIVLTGLLSVIFVSLTYLSGLALWAVAVVAAKMVITCYLSNMEINRILETNVVDEKFFKITKIDAFVNILIGAGIALILVA